jgi:hypothetical protein
MGRVVRYSDRKLASSSFELYSGVARPRSDTHVLRRTSTAIWRRRPPGAIPPRSLVHCHGMAPLIEFQLPILVVAIPTPAQGQQRHKLLPLPAAKGTCAFSKHYPPENYVIGALSDSLDLMAGWVLRWLSGVRTWLRQRRAFASRS